METTEKQKVLDISKMIRILWNKKKHFYKWWVVTFILSCVWIFPQPRFYTCEVKLAPEMGGEDVSSGLSSIASSFGVNLGGIGGQDAIYPELYPDLFESPEFVVGLYGIKVKTLDGSVSADYYTYMKEHQKVNPITFPFLWIKNRVSDFLKPENDLLMSSGDGVNPFMMGEKDFGIMETVINNVTCSIDRKTRVISINVQDQDPLVCATMADSVKEHLQAFIIRYRTSKVNEDVKHYQQMRDSVEREYNIAMDAYSRFCDTHKDVILQSFQSERDKLESELALKQNSLAVMETQLQGAKVRLQEKTPAFTTLSSAIVPIKPAGPKRMLFVIGMLILATTIKSYLLIRKYLK